jgi:hypothetical protein
MTSIILTISLHLKLLGNCHYLEKQQIQWSQNNIAMSIEFVSTISGASLVLTNIYAPCSPEGKIEFLDWFANIDMSDGTDWLIVGDFNLIRRQNDRNKPGGNVQKMMSFNEAISNLGVGELKLYGNRFTWTNKQESPLLERLD